MSWIPPTLNDTFVLGQPRPINPLYKYMKKYQIGILKIIEIPINPNDRICHGFFLHFGMIPMTTSRA